MQLYKAITYLMTFNAMMYTAICVSVHEDAEKFVLITYKDGIINCCCILYTAPPQVSFTIIILY